MITSALLFDFAVWSEELWYIFWYVCVLVIVILMKWYVYTCEFDRTVLDMWWNWLVYYAVQVCLSDTILFVILPWWHIFDTGIDFDAADTPT